MGFFSQLDTDKPQLRWSESAQRLWSVGRTLLVTLLLVVCVLGLGQRIAYLGVSALRQWVLRQTHDLMIRKAPHEFTVQPSTSDGPAPASVPDSKGASAQAVPPQRPGLESEAGAESR